MALWKPSNLSNTAAWYVADDAGNTVTGGLLTALVDKINGYTATALRGGADKTTTLNSRATLRTGPSDGSGVFQSNAAGNAIGASASAVSIFAVHKMNDANGRGFPAVASIMFGTSGNNLQTALLRSEAGTGRPAGSISLRSRPKFFDAGLEIASTSDHGSDWLIVGGSRRYGHDDGYLWVNGIQVATGTMDADAVTDSADFSVVIGTYGQTTEDTWDQNIAEIIFVRGDVSDADRQRIEGYFAWQWGLTANLGSGHPYKSAAPTVTTYGEADAAITADGQIDGSGGKVLGAVTTTLADNTDAFAGGKLLSGVAASSNSDTIAGAAGAIFGGAASVPGQGDLAAVGGKIASSVYTDSGDAASTFDSNAIASGEGDMGATQDATVLIVGTGVAGGSAAADGSDSVQGISGAIIAADTSMNAPGDFVPTFSLVRTAVAMLVADAIVEFTYGSVPGSGGSLGLAPVERRMQRTPNPRVMARPSNPRSMTR